MTDLDRLAKSLTKAQREAILSAAMKPGSILREVDSMMVQAVFTMPTGIVIIKDNSPILTSLGLALRNHLKGQNDG